MKIGVLTYPLNNNYGCYLQSYALMHFLQKEGYDVEYIMRRHNKPSWKFYIKYAFNTIFNNIKNIKWDSPIYSYEWNYMIKKGGRLFPFFENKIVPHTTPVYSTKGLAKICRNYDVIIVGSDQVWRAEILSNIEDYFLLFEKDQRIIKIAYAASFGKGNPGFTPLQIKKCGKALSYFKGVSVRENIGVKLIKEYRWPCNDCKVVLDPTMLLKIDDYTALINKKQKDQLVFAYILDETEQKLRILSKVSELLSLNSFNILHGASCDEFVYPSIENWLSCFATANFVLTDSFHGAVFSILFNVPFAVIINEGRGAARFDTLLEMFNLTDRVVHDESDIVNIVQSKISWDKVNATLSFKRKESKDFLITHLGK